MVDINVDTKPGRRRVEIRTGIERRRRWTAQQKGRIVAEAIAPGAVIAAVGRRHDVAAQQISNWIRAAKDGHFALPEDALLPSRWPARRDEPAFVQVVTTEQRQARGEGVTAIEIVVGGFVVRIANGADAATLQTVMHALKRAAS